MAEISSLPSVVLDPNYNISSEAAEGGERNRPLVLLRLRRPQVPAGKIEIDPMITHTMPLSEINAVFDLMRQGKSIRSVVVY